MSHVASHIVIQAVGPAFGDQQVRDCLTSHQCVQIDAILQKEEPTRREKRKLLRAIEDVLFHADE